MVNSTNNINNNNNANGNNKVTKSATAFARMEPTVKEQAEAILADLGISPSAAINIFYRQVIAHKGLPFQVENNLKRKEGAIDIDSLTTEELRALLEEGEKDIAEGKVYPAEEVFAELREEYGF